MPDELIVRNAMVKDGPGSVPVWREFMKYHRRISSIDFELTDNATVLPGRGL